MIIASENDLAEPMVLVPLSVHEDGIRAISDLMHITTLLEKSDDLSYADTVRLIKATLGIDRRIVKR